MSIEYFGLMISGTAIDLVECCLVKPAAVEYSAINSNFPCFCAFSVVSAFWSFTVFTWHFLPLQPVLHSQMWLPHLKNVQNSSEIACNFERKARGNWFLNILYSGRFWYQLYHKSANFHTYVFSNTTNSTRSLYHQKLPKLPLGHTFPQGILVQDCPI